MSAVVFAFSARKAESRPWQNDELAEFYRVIDMLGRAGLGVVPDMGISDEGEPWFAFCRADTGDVVVHCARIDGICVATSIATNEVFRGTSIRDVINAIIRCRQFAMVTAPSADQRIYLHPSVVLTAFIVAALLFSHQASAHTLSSDDAGTVPDAPAALAKIIATLKNMIGETVWPVTTSAPNFDQTAAGQSDPEPISLALLMSAALTVIIPAIQGSEGFLSLDEPVAPTSGSANLATPHFIVASPLFEDGTQSTTIIQSIDLLSSASGLASVSPKITDFLAGSGTLIIPLIHTELSTQTNGGTPSFLQASETSSPSFVIHAPAAPFHTGSLVVSSASDASSSTIDQPVSPIHAVDLSEITPVALAVLFGDAFTAIPTATEIAIPSKPTSSAGDTSTDVAGDSSTPAAGDSSTPAATGDTSTPATDPSTNPVPTPTPAVVDPTAPVDLLSPSTTPSTIVTDANPTLAIDLLIGYAASSHPINATITVSPDLAAALHTFEAGSTQPIQMIVFDSASVTLPFFEFAPGIFFVDDHDLGVSPSQVSPADVVTVDLASGGTMQLLGVVSTAHLTF